MSTLYVAEMGSMHKGNTALACEYARLFHEAGASILKMQFGHDPKDPVRHVSLDMAATVAHYCARLGLELMASIFSLEGLEIARHVQMKRYKVAHQKAYDNELVAAILADEVETFISTQDTPYFYISGLTHQYVRCIYTTSSYPTYPWDLQTPKDYRAWYGYSDHTHGIEACLLAVARGARYIEKHVCLDKTDLWTKDTSFSSTPAEFAELVRLGRGLERIRDAAV